MKQKLLKTMLLLCALVVGLGNIWAKDVTYTVTSTTAVSTSGTAPAGSSATYTQTFSTKCQATSGNSFTLTLSGYEGYKITGITLSMKSNSSKGGGTLSVVAGSTTIASISDSKFNTSSWYGAWSTSYVNVDVTMDNDSYGIQEDEDVVIGIAATENSLYCESYTLTYESAGSSGEETTTTIDASGITNTDVYTSTEAGSLSASVTVTEGGAAVPGANVTWTSSDTGVATIGETTGVVTLVAAGTTTITASYAGETGVYLPSTKTYNLTVTSSAPYVQPTEVEISLNNTFFGTSYDGSASGITDANPESGTQDNITITYAGSGNHYINNSQIRFYPSNKLTFEAPSGYKITQIVFTSAGTWAATISANSGTYNSSTKTWTGSATSVLFTGSGSSRCDMSKATVTLAPIGTATTTTIDYSGITNKDVYTSTDAGSLSASVTAGGTPVAGATVTWSSSDTDVATIGETTGVVTLVAAGTTTITASYGGNATYDGSSDTYELTVTNSAPPTTYTLVTAITSGKHYVIANGKYSEVKIMAGQNGNYRDIQDASVDAEVLSVSGAREIVIQGPDADGYYTLFDATANGYLYASSSSSNDLKTQGNIDNDARWQITINGETGVASIVAKGDNTRNVMQYNSSNPRFSCYSSASQTDVYLFEKDGESAPTESVSITSSEGYATYASNNALDFTGKDIKAYIAKANGTTGVTFHQVNKVPAREGVLLYNASGATTLEIPVATAKDDVSGNVFKRGTGETVASVVETTKHNYILNNIGGNIGFYRANGQMVAKNRAYIQIDEGAGIKEFISLDLEDAPDGISLTPALSEGEGAIYNLAGQRLSKMQKGINIVNGKKVLK